ncbi:beta-lactamase [Salinisphaera sp. S4-8]|uniref:MBL fold metallo-hydrolase n=1 Tax=Salinisphaera sp. S4-8 TaxID=633357 RepID=UPI0033415A5E
MNTSARRGKQTPRWLTGPARQRTRFCETPVFRKGLYALGSHSHAWMVPNGSWGETNTGLVVCGNQTVLIDTCWDVRTTQAMLDGASDLLRDAPIEHVINSHADGDHWWGNQLLAGRHIIATDACISQMDELKPNSLRALSAASHGLEFVPGLGPFSRYMRGMFAPYDFAGIRLTYPNDSFSGRHTLTVSGVTLELIELGPAHTEGDYAVFVPDERVVYAADVLFVGATPLAWAGPIANVTAGLERLLALEADVFVPGHGAIADRADVQQALDYWDFIQNALYAEKQRGRSPLEAAQAVAASDTFKRQPFAGWDSPERIVTNAFTLYRDWGVALRDLPEPLGRLNILRRQADLARAMPGACPACMHGAMKAASRQA